MVPFLRKRLATGLASVSVGVFAVAAYANDIHLLPVPAVVLPDGAGDTQRLLSLIDRPKANARFLQGLRAAFPGVVDDIPNADRKTFSTAVQINRVSRYAVDKGDGTSDLFVAITATIYFLNPSTDEILFSYSATDYSVQAVLPGQTDDDNHLTALINSTCNNVLDAVIKKASSGFHPYNLTATVTGKVHGLAVLSAGTDAGFRNNDELIDDAGNELEILYAAPSYAVARSGLGAAETGHSFTKTTNAALAEVRKPDLFTVPDSNQPDIAQTFMDAVGDAGKFTVVPVSPQYTMIKNAVAEHSHRQPPRAGRPLPAYFARISLTAPKFAVVPTNLPYKSLHITKQTALLEILDRAGHVLYADAEPTMITDEVTAGVAFKQSDRSEIAVRNAMVTLAQRADASLAFRTVNLKISGGDEHGFVIDDPQARLGASGTFTVLAPSGLRAGVDLPIWSAHMLSRSPSGVQASPDIPATDQALPIHAGYTVEANAFGYNGAMAPQAIGIAPKVAALGNYDLTDYQALAITSFVKSTHQILLQPDTAQNGLAALTASGMFERSDASAPAVPTIAIEPVQRIDVGDKVCDVKAVCSYPISVKLTVRLKRGSDIVSRVALQAQGHSRGFPQTTQDVDARAVLDIDVEAQVLNLLDNLYASPDFTLALNTLLKED